MMMMRSLSAVLPHPPIITESPSNQTAYVGETVKFRCVILSDLQPHIQWVKHYDVNGSYTDVNGSWYLTPIPTVSLF